ncbi:hypothetical protein LTR09_001786 [Extremus antarcticus]|uniref:Uncharacterized protein n=1 Tax=Extremus antarcticus TaxID=702011 RepID=A0AAJ0LW82_9PEZI|nr:hypothetical protein LTR09_001786 [Extremus antarcticus]
MGSTSKYVAARVKQPSHKNSASVDTPADVTTAASSGHTDHRNDERTRQLSELWTAVQKAETDISRCKAVAREIDKRRADLRAQVTILSVVPSLVLKEEIDEVETEAVDLERMENGFELDMRGLETFVGELRCRFAASREKGKES